MGVGGTVPPKTCDWEFFAYVSKKEARCQGKEGKGVKIEKKRRKNGKREGGKMEMEVGKVIKR